jgi:putative phosphoesterase
MKSVLFSDAHANYAAVEAVFQHEQHWDEVIFLGDALQFGPHPDEVLSALRKTDACCILGNHDAEVLHIDAITEIDHQEHLDWLTWTREQLSEENLTFLQNRFGGTAVISRDGLTIRLHHGDWKFDTDTRLFPDSPEHHFNAVIENYPEPVILFGHSHIQHDFECGGRRFVNPGSAGHTRLNNPVSCYAVLHNGEIFLKQVPYDIKKTVRGMDRLPLPENFVEMWKESFRTGKLPPLYDIKDFTQLRLQGYR